MDSSEQPATALEVLEKSPGVVIDQNGNISVKGKSNVLIYLDGKPTYMSNADLLRMRFPAPLPVELREVADRGVFPQRQAVLPRQLEEMRQQPRVSMHVVVGVEMRWRTAHQRSKAAELRIQLSTTGGTIGEIGDRPP